MRRRIIGLLVTLALGFLVVPLAVTAPRAGKVWRMGYLPSGSTTMPEAFRQGLRDLGYVEGQNLIIEHRSGEGRFESLAGLAAELVHLPVDVMVTHGTPAALAAKEATSTLPIVFLSVADPVGSGLIASWGQPAGNITGAASASVDFNTAKTLELLKEVVPAATRVAVLVTPNHPLYGTVLPKLQAAARLLRIDLHRMEVRDPATDLERAFATLAHERVDALCMLGDQSFDPHRTRIVELVAARRLPAIYGSQALVRAGGLMSYTSDSDPLARSASVMVDKILRGSKPADIPAEFPIKFKLIINLTTAQALGLTIPPSLLFQADEILR
jgi:putative ABC transport system substrate-binding protein